MDKEEQIKEWFKILKSKYSSEYLKKFTLADFEKEEYNVPKDISISKERALDSLYYYLKGIMNGLA